MFHYDTRMQLLKGNRKQVKGQDFDSLTVHTAIFQRQALLIRLNVLHLWT